MALDRNIVELAFSIPVWRQKSQLFIYCDIFYWMLEQMPLHQIIVPRVTRNIADIFAVLLLREGVEPNPGPIPVSDPEQRLSERLHRILHGSNCRAESPSSVSFRKCLAEASRDAQMTRTPGDGMNTPPPEPKPPDCGSRSTKTRNSRDDCGTTPDGVYTDTVKDVHPRAVNDVSTRSDFISSRSATISNCGQVSDKEVDGNDSHSATPSVSGSSLDINYIIAQARAESRVAANTEDDFYCYTSSSEEDVNSPKRISSKDRTKPNRNMWNDEGQIAVVSRSVNDEISDEERELNYCPTPSMSRSSLDVDNILAPERTDSRTTLNMDDDFYSNDSGADEVRHTGRKTFSLKGKFDIDREHRDSPSRHASKSSLNIEDICAQARLESCTAFNMDDDFFTNSECSDVDKETRKTFNAREDGMSTMKVSFTDVKLQRSETEHKDTIIRTTTPNMGGNVTLDSEGETDHILYGQTASVRDSKNRKSGGLAGKYGMITGVASNQREDAVFLNGFESINHIQLSPSSGQTKLRSNKTEVSIKQRSNAEINIRTAVTTVRHGSTQSADLHTDAAVVIEDVSRRPDDSNNSNFEQFTDRKDSTLVLECLQTRSLTVAKFRAMLNRTCILLPDTDNCQVDEDLRIEQGQVNRATSKAATDRFNNKEWERQHRLHTFRKKVDEINHKASLLLDIQIQRNDATIGERDQLMETGEVPGVEQRLRESSVVKDTDHRHKGAQLCELKSGTKLTPHVPAGPKSDTKLTPHVPAGPKYGTKLTPHVPAGPKPNTKLTPHVPAGPKYGTKLTPHVPAGPKPDTKLTPHVPAGPKSDTKLTPHVPAGPKPSFVRKGRKYKQMSVKEQVKMKSKIENNEILIPKAPTVKNHSDFKDVKKGRRIHK